MAKLIEKGEDGKKRLNTEEYNKKVNNQKETFAKIDSVMTVLEQLPAFLDTTSVTYSISPFAFLFKILRTLGVDEATLKRWIIEILMEVLPTVEIGLKASLLINLKKLVSCNSDPRIPNKYRKFIGGEIYSNIFGDNEESKRGFDINVAAIDPNGMLDMSPFTKPGMLMYFGCVAESMYNQALFPPNENKIATNEGAVVTGTNLAIGKLVRADDFNAFLWYAMHKGLRQNPIPARFTATDTGFKGIILNGKTYLVTKGSANLLEPFEISAINSDGVIDGKETITIPAGTTLYDPDNPRNLAMYMKGIKYNDDGDFYTGQIVPVSSDWYSCNWYVDKSNYYGANLSAKKKANRNYSNEKAICNIRYYEATDWSGRHVTGPSMFNFTILPKPCILLPSVTTTTFEYDVFNGQEYEKKKKKIETLQKRIIRLLFDADGNPTSSGKYTLPIERTPENNSGTGLISAIPQNPLGNGTVNFAKNTLEYNVLAEDGGTVTKLVVDLDTGYYKFENPAAGKTRLVECYPGLTVYEFNYDYVMGMRLFDPKVICQRVFDNATNSKYDASFTLTLNKTKNKSNYTQFDGNDGSRVLEIVREIIASDDEEINDCFFNFSNEQINDMLHETEQIKYHQMPFNEGYSVDFSEVTNILSEYPENGTLEEQKDVISRALDVATATVSGDRNIDKIATSNYSSSSNSSSSASIDFLTNILEQLVMSLTDAILSPKVLMLLYVNNELLGGNGEALKPSDLMKLMKGVIKSMISEIKDMIMQKIMDYILEQLMPLALKLQAAILSEQTAAYLAVLRLYLAWFNKGVSTANRLSAVLSALFSKFKRGGYNINGITNADGSLNIDLPTVLDDVNYADIYTTELSEMTPIIKDC